MVSPDSAALTLLALKDFSHSALAEPAFTPSKENDKSTKTVSSHIWKTPFDSHKRSLSVDESPVTDDENEPESREPFSKPCRDVEVKQETPIGRPLSNPGLLCSLHRRDVHAAPLPRGKPLARPPALATLASLKGLKPLSSKLM